MIFVVAIVLKGCVQGSGSTSNYRKQAENDKKLLKNQNKMSKKFESDFLSQSCQRDSIKGSGSISKNRKQLKMMKIRKK